MSHGVPRKSSYRSLRSGEAGDNDDDSGTFCEGTSSEATKSWLAGDTSRY